MPLLSTFGAASARALGFGGVRAITTWNPADKNANVTLSGGNLTATQTAASTDGAVRGTTSKSTGKWHFEVYVAAGATGRPSMGIANSSQSLSASNGADSAVIFQNGTPVIAGVSQPLVTAMTTPGYMAIEVDLDNSDIYFQFNGGSRDGPYDISGISGPFFPFVCVFNTGNSGVANFGQSAFSVAVTSGYSAWG
jgi:hypothetical protein